MTEHHRPDAHDSSTTPNSGGPSANAPPIVPHDFSPETVAHAPIPAPVVVVTGRRRSWWSPFIIPSIIIASGFLFASGRLPMPHWLRSRPNTPIAETLDLTASDSQQTIVLQVEPSAPASPDIGTAPGGMVLPVLSLAPKAPLPTAGVIRPAPPSRSIADLAAARASAQDRALAEALVPKAPTETERALDGIRKEAEARQAEKIETETLLADVPRIEKAVQVEKVKTEAQRRLEFRAELARALDQLGDAAGPSIWEIMARFHNEPGRAVELRIARELRELKRPLNRAGRVDFFRSHGLPEPIILAELYREQARRAVARNGPRSRDEAIVRGARQLLAIPFDATTTAQRPH